MSGPSEQLAPTSGYTIRRLQPGDAGGVTRLVEQIYGSTYHPPDLYDPERIVQLNAAGQLISVVTLDPAGQVVGHYALERPGGLSAAVAESSDAIVLPEHRHHHLMEQMRLLLREEADRLGLVGLVGYPVTNHVFSQDAEEHFGAHPCGVALGLWPGSFHNMPEPMTQRMSFVIYFKLLRQRERVLHVTTHHQEIISRICQLHGITAGQREDGAPPAGAGEIAVEHEPAVQTATVRVVRVGADTVDAVRRACAELCKDLAGVKALTLELPLAQPGAAAVCRAAEEEQGFFFSGLGPAFASDGGDALLLQLPLEEVDLSVLKIDHPFARDLLAYVGGERARVWKKKRS